MLGSLRLGGGGGGVVGEEGWFGKKQNKPLRFATR